MIKKSPMPPHLILIQSLTLREAISVSRSSRPLKAGHKPGVIGYTYLIVTTPVLQAKVGEVTQHVQPL
ncbi:hypothetical protein E2C01_017681 [Portunus trituberculatus]|uniref:Uncharacterized protein n=1 Tax=Portunus trituberculatus TaxID=210409 RepID=A0A5B7DTI8_PORTR|nr:hypothetical protein [Portunus trituberculatus]